SRTTRASSGAVLSRWRMSCRPWRIPFGHRRSAGGLASGRANHVYHPAFAGSFSPKSVLPALVPELWYDERPLAGGVTASSELERLLLRGAQLGSAERNRLRSNLRRYSDQDTLGLLKLLERLRHLVGL